MNLSNIPQLHGAHIHILSEVSQQDLQALARDGHSLLRSAHCGNLLGYNLQLLQAFQEVPFELNLYDRRMTGYDSNYKPERLIRSATGGGIERLTEHAKILVPYAEDGRGASLSYRHLHQLRQLSKQVFTYSQWIMRHRTAIEVLLRKLEGRAPELFDRYVNKEGQIYHLKAAGTTANTYHYRVREDLYTDETTIPHRDLTNLFLEGAESMAQRSTEGAGPRAATCLTSNEVTTFLYGYIEARRTGKDIYHLSGPDMVHYMREFQEAFDHIWSLLDIPPEESFIYNVIPSTGFQYNLAQQTVDTTKRAMLEKLSHCIAAYDKHIRAVRKILTPDIEGLLGDIFRENDKPAMPWHHINMHTLQEHFLRQHLTLHGTPIDSQPAPNTLQYDTEYGLHSIKNFLSARLYQQLKTAHAPLQDIQAYFQKPHYLQKHVSKTIPMNTHNIQHFGPTQHDLTSLDDLVTPEGIQQAMIAGLEVLKQQWK